MKNMITMLAAAGLGAAAFAQGVSTAPTKLMHVSTSFDLVVHALYAETAPLFGPEGERVWAGNDWNPQFLYPQPAQDSEGAVFTIQRGPLNVVWVNTLFDLEARHFQYVYFITDVMVTTIDLRFMPVSNESTQVNVIYTRTALTPEGNKRVAAMRDHDTHAGKDWQEQIDAYLRSRNH